ncbi:hypothetical protein JYU08_00005 [bacterium AH-315-B06]|nr:hypothetical protein [bacterium AH-315-B06]
MQAYPLARNIDRVAVDDARLAGDIGKGRGCPCKQDGQDDETERGQLRVRRRSSFNQYYQRTIFHTPNRHEKLTAP